MREREGFSTPSRPRADQFVVRILGRASRVAALGVKETLAVAKVLAVEVLDTPEAAGGNRGLLRVGGHGGDCSGGG